MATYLIVQYLYIATLLSYLALVFTIGRSALQNREGRWSGLLLALLMLTMPGWVMGACWLFEYFQWNMPVPLNP
jgi:hypothetical protein